MSFQMFQFFFPDAALFCFFLAAPGKLDHRVSFKFITRHAVRSSHRAPGSFSGANSNSTNSNFLAGRMPTLHSFGGAHLRAARPQISIYLFFARRHRLLGQQPVPALLRSLAKRILDDPVFERVKADHYQPSAWLQHPGRSLQQCFQIVQFTVYEDSESLKGSGRRMNSNSLMFPVH